MHLNVLSSTLKILGEENRLKILCLLITRKKLCVSMIAELLTLHVATASFHLNVLEKHGILTSTREGKEVCYEIKNTPLLKDIKKIICKYV